MAFIVEIVARVSSEFTDHRLSHPYVLEEYADELDFCNTVPFEESWIPSYFTCTGRWTGRRNGYGRAKARLSHSLWHVDSCVAID